MLVVHQFVFAPVLVVVFEMILKDNLDGLVCISVVITPMALDAHHPKILRNAQTKPSSADEVCNLQVSCCSAHDATTISVIYLFADFWGNVTRL